MRPISDVWSHPIVILYKYLQPARLDVLKHRRIRFTQPGDFNDPFEFRPRIGEVASDAKVRAYVEQNFDRLVDEELAKYGALTQLVPGFDLRGLLAKQKAMLPVLFRILEPAAIEKLSPAIYGVLNLNVGLLCLSEVRDSVLMWGHYTENHQGFVVGFDSDDTFFHKRRSDKDEFGFLRQVEYRAERPNVTLTNTASADWFQTKSEHWSYEREWRIVRVLTEANHRIERSPFPICLFDFAPEAIREIIVGMRCTPSFRSEVRSLSESFPRATLLAASEASGYELEIVEAPR